jgi:hypothetical protein
VLELWQATPVPSATSEISAGRLSDSREGFIMRGNIEHGPSRRDPLVNAASRPESL